MDACRQGNGSRVTAWRTQPSAASVSFSLLRSLPPFYSLSLILDLARLAHAPGATDSSGLGGHRAHAPVLTPRAPLTPSLSISLKRAGRSSYSPSLSRALSLSLRSRRVFIHVYTHTLSPSRIMSYPTHSPSVSYGSVVSIDRAFRESSRPSPTAQTQHKMNAARASRQRDYRRELSRDSYLHRLWHTSLDVPLLSCFVPLLRSAAFAASPSRGYFLPSEFIPRISHCFSLTLS